MNDPATYTAPFTVRTMWTTQPSLEEVYEYACHEGNYAVSGGLAGERTFERDVAEAKAKGLTGDAEKTFVKDCRAGKKPS